jgi:hypothetical protein
MPGTVIAGGDFGGVWQPFSRPVEWLGAMTVTPDRLSYSAGPQARLEQVSTGGSVFRLTEPQGEGFEVCGPEPVSYVGFRILDNGQLAILHYTAATPPPDPTGNDATQIVRNGACSVMFYTR